MASFTGVTVTEADAYRAVVGFCEDILRRAGAADIIVGTTAAGRAIKPENAGAPNFEMHHPPMLVAPNTVDLAERTKLANYTLAVARWFVGLFNEYGVAHSVVLSNIAYNASINTMITAIRGEMVNLVTAYNAGIGALGGTGNSNFLQLPTPPAIA